MSTATTPNLTRFWLALERIPGPAAVAAEWRHLIRSDFETASRWMVPDSDLAASYPRFDQPWFSYAVIEHSPDNIVGVCEEDGSRVRLSRADLVVYRVDLTKLMADVAAAFGFAAEGTSVADLARTYRVGTYRPHGGLAIPVYLTIRIEHPEYKAVVDGLIAATRGSFILLAPTNKHHRIACQLLLDSHQCLFLALADALRTDAPRWELNDETRAALDTFAERLTTAGERPVLEEPLSDRAQEVLIAMLQMGALDSDRRQPTADIAVKAIGPEADANALKAVVADLVKRELIATKGGRDGGCWLTGTGKRRAEKLGVP